MADNYQCVKLPRIYSPIFIHLHVAVKEGHCISCNILQTFHTSNYQTTPWL